ncbi:cytoplasmic protein [Enterobacterales bacterium CwR94]|nr:cytoplasmic protein [Enterobacterales bacterium CwR94]
MDGSRLQACAADYALQLPQSEKSNPFGPEHDVYKVADKIFMMTTEVRGIKMVTVKGTPEDNLLQCTVYDSVTPGYHMNKRHWISIAAGPQITPAVIEGFVATSYHIVVQSLPKYKRPVLA